jgi:hypothetical protein
MLHIAQSISTYTEQIERPETIKTIARYLAEAETLVFLGFGYHRQNLDLLTPKSPVPQKRSTLKVFGTAFGLSDSDREIISGELKTIGFNFSNMPSITIRNDLGCKEFLDQYRRSISVE